MVIEKLTPLQVKIVCELGIALGKIKAPLQLQAAIGSWGDTIPEIDVLELLYDFNQEGLE